MSEWLFNCLIQQFSAISWREQVNFQSDNNEARFELDQHAYFGFV